MTAIALQRLHAGVQRIDPIWLLSPLVLAVAALLDPGQAGFLVGKTAGNFAHTAVFIALTALTLGAIRASDADGLVAKAFQAHPARAVVLAAMVGALAPLCSCEIVPLIAALLRLGVPFGPIMALWLASPIIDPGMYLVTVPALGVGFATYKVFAAIAMGITGGFLTLAWQRAGGLDNQLKPQATSSCCASSCGPSSDADVLAKRVVWRFWHEPARRKTFVDEATEAALFVGKWLLLAYVIESLMLAYIPADAIASVIGGSGPLALGTAALVGVPAYLNGYAAVPLISGLMEIGLQPGPAMAFMIAGSVTCVPAMVAVFALVKRRLFAAYVGLGMAGALVSGWLYGLMA